MPYALQELQNISKGKPAYPQSNRPTTYQQFQNNAGINKQVLGSQNTNPPLQGGGSGFSPSPVQQQSSPVPQGPSQDDINREIDAAFSSGLGYLDQTERQLREQQPGFEKQITDQYNLNVQDLTGQKQSAFDRFGVQEQQAQGRKEDAMSAARRLYQELQQGAQQRFGGASSAGVAAFELAGRESQRQFGNINKEFTGYAQELNNQRNEVERNFTVGIEKLRLETENRRLQAQQEFQSRLNEINRSRSDLYANKAQARLSALQDMRNKIFQIQLMDRQMENQLALQRQNSMAYINNFTSTTANSAGVVDQAYNQAVGNMSTNPQTSLTYGNSAATNQPNQYIGQINSRKRDEYFA